MVFKQGDSVLVTWYFVLRFDRCEMRRQSNVRSSMPKIEKILCEDKRIFPVDGGQLQENLWPLWQSSARYKSINSRLSAMALTIVDRRDFIL